MKLAPHRLGRTRRTLAVVFFLAWLGLAPTAFAQHGSDVGQAPPPPPGPGSLVVELVSEEPGLSLEARDLALYALDPNGMPGLANGVTDADGRHVFAGISNDPGIVYLVGARLGDIPFGERVTFVEGETDARVEIRVSSPTTEIRGVTVDELRIRLDWMGDRVVVTEILKLTSRGTRVIRLPSDDSAGALFERPLPDAATDFNPGPNSIGDELAMRDGRVRFYGPLYAGEQRVEYQWSLPLEGPGRDADFEIALREAIGRLVVVAGTAGLTVEGDGLVPSRALADDDARRLASWARDGLRAGEPLRVAFTLPESRRDPGAVTLPRADVWVDFDDTRLEANVDLNLLVSDGAPVTGTPEAPLLHVSIPRGASLEGVSPEAEAFGLVPTEDGGFDVIGPIGPGEHSLGFQYRMPSRPDGVQVDMRFPREVQTLNVLIADTGLALESRRLHRRRPFRNRTRNYLHREAYNVGMHETVDLRLEPLRGAGLPQQATLAITLLGAAAAAWFMISPLRRSQRSAPRFDPTLARLREEREGVYADIADLDHDFETGKLDEADYAAMRDDLRGQAIELLRAERAHETSDAPPSSEPAPYAAAPSASSAASSAAPTTSAAPVATGGFCPACGGRIDPKWRFCSHCGSGLQPGDAAESEG